jgi:hypothetical protein
MKIVRFGRWAVAAILGLWLGVSFLAAAIQRFHVAQFSPAERIFLTGEAILIFALAGQGLVELLFRSGRKIHG